MSPDIKVGLLMLVADLCWLFYAPARVVVAERRSHQ